jgi:hypothetical protein
MELLSKIRGTISAGTRLTSHATRQELMKVYDWLISLDEQLSIMADEGRSQKEWEEFHEKKFDEAGDQIDSAISRLAIDLGLYSGNVSEPDKRLTINSI